MSQTRDQQRYTIWEVAADWHEAMVPQRIFVKLSVAVLSVSAITLYTIALSRRCIKNLLHFSIAQFSEFTIAHFAVADFTDPTKKWLPNLPLPNFPAA